MRISGLIYPISGWISGWPDILKELCYYLAGFPAKIFAGYPGKSVSGATLIISW